MQDNAIIIKLEDGDITTAQDDPDIEGIIHIPSIEYDHLVQEVQVPGQSFFNGLYINVQDLEIGGSGLPIIINNFEYFFETMNYLSTRDFISFPQIGYITVPGGSTVFTVRVNNTNNEIWFSAIRVSTVNEVELYLSIGDNTIIKYFILDKYITSSSIYVRSDEYRITNFSVTTKSNSGSSAITFNSAPKLYTGLFEFDWGNN